MGWSSLQDVEAPEGTVNSLCRLHYSIENRQDILAMNLQPHDLEDLKPEVRRIYDHRLNLQNMTEEDMEYYNMDIQANIALQQHDLKDLKPEFLEIYNRRMKM